MAKRTSRRSKRRSNPARVSKWSTKALHTAIMDTIDHVATTNGTFVWTPKKMKIALAFQYGYRVTNAKPIASALKAFTSLGGTPRAAMFALGSDRYEAVPVRH